MDRIFSDEKIVIDIDKENSLLKIAWKTGCDNILEEDIESRGKRIRDMARSKEPRRILFDLSKCTYNVTPESGPWYEHTLFSMFDDLEPHKLAYVVPENLFSHIFFEASRARETAGVNTRVQYFNKEGKAIDWLLTDDSM